MRVADLLHLRQQPVHDGVGGLVVEQAVRDRHALHEGEPVVVQLAVGALPAGEHAGGGIQKRRRVGGAELGGLLGEELRVVRVLQLPGEFGEHRGGAIGQRVGEGVLVAEVDRVPPVRRAPVGLRAVAEVAGAGVFDEAVAVLVGGEHLAAPRGELVVIGARPLPVARAVDVVAGRDQERGQRVERSPRRFPAESGRRRSASQAVADLAVALRAGEVTVERHADEVEAGQAVGQRRRVQRQVGILEERERDTDRWRRCWPASARAD